VHSTSKINLKSSLVDSVENYWDNYYALSPHLNDHWHLKPFKESIMKVLPLHNTLLPIRILDLGCANGHLVKLLRENGVEAYGLDISRHAVDNAPEAIKCFLKVIDIEKDVLPFSDMFFDVCVSMSTFEHINIEKISLALSKIKRVLKPNGLLLINVPTHSFTRKNLVRLVENNGFSYMSKLSRSFDAIRIKEIAALYISSQKSFHLKNLRLRFPRAVAPIVSYLMMMKRKLFASNFSLVYRLN